MPHALLRACSGRPGCPNLVEHGRCAECAQTHEQAVAGHRASSHARGFTRRWYAFKAWLINRMVALDIAPVCGARLPGAPVTNDSRCQAQGLLVEGTQADHIVPYIRPDGSIDRRLQYDPLNIQLLCESCHSRKTASRDGGFGREATG